MMPGRDVPNSELVGLRLRGQLGELKDLALFSDAQEADDLKKGANKLRSILVEEGSVSGEAELVGELAG